MNIKLCIAVLAFSAFSSFAHAEGWEERVEKEPHVLGLNVGNLTGPSFNYTLSPNLELNTRLSVAVADSGQSDMVITFGVLGGGTWTMPLSPQFHFRALGAMAGISLTRTKNRTETNLDTYFPFAGIGLSRGPLEITVSPAISYSDIGDTNIITVVFFDAAIRVRF